MNGTSLKTVAALVLALAIGSAGAQQAGLQSYNVELVVFSNLTGQGTAEAWVQEVTPQSALAGDEEESAGAIASVPPLQAATESFPAMPGDKMQLNAIADQLRRSRGYRPLAHLGWTQPGFPRGEARYMSIDPLVSGADLSGRVALSRGRYLHLTLDLTLRNEATGERYTLRQTRRMRSTERHYIDHPKFGVIAVITPTE